MSERVDAPREITVEWCPECDYAQSVTTGEHCEDCGHEPIHAVVYVLPGVEAPEAPDTIKDLLHAAANHGWAADRLVGSEEQAASDREWEEIEARAWRLFAAGRGVSPEAVNLRDKATTVPYADGPELRDEWVLLSDAEAAVRAAGRGSGVVDAELVEAGEAMAELMRLWEPPPDAWDAHSIAVQDWAAVLARVRGEGEVHCPSCGCRPCNPYCQREGSL